MFEILFDPHLERVRAVLVGLISGVCLTQAKFLESAFHVSNNKLTAASKVRTVQYLNLLLTRRQDFAELMKPYLLELASTSPCLYAQVICHVTSPACSSFLGNFNLIDPPPRDKLLNYGIFPNVEAYLQFARTYKDIYGDSDRMSFYYSRVASS